MVLELLQKRRSIRRFAETPVEREKIASLVETMLRSPSSRSLNPWEFVVVTDRNTIKELAVAKTHGSSFMAGAPLAIVICADPEKCDVWIEDCAIATILIHLAAADLGLGSCWVQVRLREHASGKRAEDHVKKVLGLDDKLVVEAMVAIGYAAEDKPGHPQSSLLYDRVRYVGEMG
jgi:nitroreductase